MNFENELKNAKESQKMRYEKIISNFENIEIDEKEKHYLLWLSGCDDETEEIFSKLFLKLKKQNE